MIRQLLRPRGSEDWGRLMQTACHRRAGFTLVELMVASVILAIAIIGLAQLYLTALSAFEKSRYLSVATGRAQLELERVQETPYSELLKSVNNADFIEITADGVDDPIGAFLDLDGYTQLAGNNGVHFTVDGLPSGEGLITFQKYNNYESLLMVTIEITWEGARPARSPVKVVTLLSGSPTPEMN